MFGSVLYPIAEGRADTVKYILTPSSLSLLVHVAVAMFVLVRHTRMDQTNARVSAIRLGNADLHVGKQSVLPIGESPLLLDALTWDELDVCAVCACVRSRIQSRMSGM